MKKKDVLITGSFLALGLYCVSKRRKYMPKGAVVVAPFDIDSYLGKWYEIARLDFIHEKNLSHCSATYSKEQNGDIKVVNQGYNMKTGAFQEAVGKAKFRMIPNIGALKVSFFGPFYSGYNVIALDPAYQSALIAGDNLHYLWILSRRKTLGVKIKKEYMAIAESLGYDTGALVWTNQKKEEI